MSERYINKLLSLLSLTIILTSCSVNTPGDYSKIEVVDADVTAQSDNLTSEDNVFTTIDGFNYNESYYIISADIEGDIMLPTETKGVSCGAFEGSEHINSLTFDSPIDITSGSFMDSGITSITLESIDTHIQTMAFLGCENLTSIRINGSIDIGAFRDCPNISSIELMEGLTTILPGTFDECCVINELKLPSSMVNLTSESFRGCTINKIIGYKDTLAESFASEVGAEFVSIN